ncbi:MAG TPA: hypothetical protein VF589_08130 [Allosphingosinicella sp.]|jgi:hypothetical protein
MRIVILAALLALSGCGRAAADGDGNGGAPITAAAPANSSAAAPAGGTFPPDFPAADATSNGSACYLYLMIAAGAADAATGFDAPAMEQAAGQWRALLLQTMAEEEVRQFTAGETNFRLQTPPAERNAAARWCVENAPEVDPAG